MRIYLNKNEVEALRDQVQASIDCEKDSRDMAGYYETSIRREKAWKSIKRKIRKKQ